MLPQVTRLGIGQIEYSSVNCFSDDWMLGLIGKGPDHFGLWRGTTFVRDLPNRINASSEPRWRRDDPNTFLYLSGAAIRYHNVVTGTDEEVRTFEEYDRVSGLGEGDTPGDLMALCGDGHEIFTVDVVTGERFNALPRSKWMHPGLDSLYVTHEGHVLAAWGGRIDLLDRDMKHIRQVTMEKGSTGHKDVCRNSAGDECMCWINANTLRPGPPNTVMLVRLADGQEKPLLSLEWSLACHISCCDTGALVSTYAPSNKLPGELIFLDFEGDVKWRIPTQSEYRGYSSASRASVSQDGRKAAGSSNFGLFPEQKEYTEIFQVTIGDEAIGTGTAVTTRRRGGRT